MIIDQLPLLGGDVQGTDEFPIERGTTTYKTTQAALIKPATDAAAAAQAAADDAQLAADNAQETADEANEKGLPPGGTAGQVLAKADSSDYSASWEDPSGGGDVTADMLGIVIDGNSTPVGASAGQYVIVKDSTITGITDGLYKAALAIPANTAIDSTYLTPVSDGGMNDLLSRTQRHLLWTNASPASDFAAQTVSLDLSVYDLVFIEYAQDKLNDNYYYSYFFKIDGKIHMAIGFAGGKMARRFNTVNASGIYFGEGQIASTYASTFTTANTNMIPINIYGIK